MDNKTKEFDSFVEEFKGQYPYHSVELMKVYLQFRQVKALERIAKALKNDKK